MFVNNVEFSENDVAEVRSLFGLADSTPPAADPAPAEPPAPAVDTSAAADTKPAQTTEPSDTTGSTTTEPAPSGTAPTKPTPADDTQLDPESKFNKQNSAFAQMRVQNKQYSDMIMNLARATGQNPSNIEEAQALLQEGLNKVVAKNRNIPEDVLREMDRDKQELSELRQAQARQNALAGFQRVKDTFGLSRDDVNEFADKLIAAKINPFEQSNVDLVKEYKNIYFDKLIEQAVEKGIQAERARALKATQSSTAPTATRGTPDNTGNQVKQINTVDELNALLDSLK